MADAIGILLLCLILLMCEWGTLSLNFLFLSMFILSKNLITFLSAFHQLYIDNTYPDENVCFIFSHYYLFYILFIYLCLFVLFSAPMMFNQ